MKRSREEYEKQIQSHSYDECTMHHRHHQSKYLCGGLNHVPLYTVFPDDICFEICLHLPSGFIVKNCSLISKQWLKVIKERIKLSIVGMGYYNVINPLSTIYLPYKHIHKFSQSQFLGNVVEIIRCDWENVVPLFPSLRRQLTSIDISYKQIGDEDVKLICELTQLTSLKVCYNRLGDEGAKSISNLKHLTSLDISINHIGDEGVKFIREMKQLTKFEAFYNCISIEGVKLISEMKQLTWLDISKNQIDDEAAQLISNLKQLKVLYIAHNQIGDELKLLLKSNIKKVFL